MGVDLGDIVPRRVMNITELPKSKIAIDAYNALYQFLTIIRQPDGTPLLDSYGRVTSHLQGLFYRTINLVELGLKPIYVFDGDVLPIKRKEIEQRVQRKEKAKVEAYQAIQEGRYDVAYRKSMQAASLTGEMVMHAKTLLSYMGIPIVQAPFEGEAQAAKIVIDGQAYACASQDYDALLFGTPRLIRNLTISGKRKLPGRNQYVEVKPELIYLDEVLKQTGLTRRQLVEVGVLIGTDYNPAGFPGIGPKTALQLIKKHSSIHEALKVKGIEIDFDIEALIKEFLQPRVSQTYEVKWGSVDIDGLRKFLCQEHDFSQERVDAALQRYLNAISKPEQKSLDNWFSAAA
ncbi:MAG: flap endonuclease-1 [Thermoprotei archaeon]